MKLPFVEALTCLREDSEALGTEKRLWVEEATSQIKERLSRLFAISAPDLRLVTAPVML